MSARHIGLIANDTKPGARELVESLLEAFAKHPVEVLLETRTAQLICTIWQ